MVQVRNNSLSVNDKVQDYAESWVKINCHHYKQHITLVLDAIRYLKEQEKEKEKHSCLNIALNICEVLCDLNLSVEVIIASILFPYFQINQTKLSTLPKQFSSEIKNLIEGTLRLQILSDELDFFSNHQNNTQLQPLRKMILAMADDPRIVVIKLAEQLVWLRRAIEMNSPEQKLLATQVASVYAPLANRLGIWQLKWELEDLSFRILHPKTYKRIARLLDEKRLVREAYIQQVSIILNESLVSEKINAEITSRVKHIYSIWRKMQRKDIEFSDIYDVRAMRIIVKDIRSCYAALGVVHQLWRNIASEFDDYIATPKDNGYQSLHTAVIGPEGKIIEIQIRTLDMHNNSEQGVAAHWMYKESVSHEKRTKSYHEQIVWLRQLLAWQSEMADANELMQELKYKILSEQIYLLTPKGQVIELPQGATPIDFAYSVHTEVGHRCRGAKVSGKMVPLTYALKTGEQVEILTGKVAAPSRDWLNTNLGYITSPRSRSKIQQWFRLQEKDSNILAGKQIMDRELQKLGVTSVNYQKVSEQFNVATGDDVLAAIATGDIKVAHVLTAANISIPADDAKKAVIPVIETPRLTKPLPAETLTVNGERNFLFTLAQCCQPLPGDSVLGYITQGQGISVHRRDCSNLLQNQANKAERLVDVDWGNAETTYPVSVLIEAYERSNLLKELTAVIAHEKMRIVAMNSRSDKKQNKVFIKLTLEISSLDKLSFILDKIYQLPNVITVHRKV